MDILNVELYKQLLMVQSTNTLTDELGEMDEKIKVFLVTKTRKEI